ncbi:hypothetical protein K1719_020653 [Acacia pycnantha]|nr:hypothetical protein K1719_020653 [Acacia pycnantha]
MKEDGVVADSQAFKGILDSFIRSGKFDSALEIFLIALVRNNQVCLALFIFLKLLDAESNGCGDVGFAPNSFVCNELLAALRKARHEGRI